MRAGVHICGCICLQCACTVSLGLCVLIWYVCACAHGFICPHRLYVWVCMCALEGGCLCQCRQPNPGAASREAAVVGDRPPPALRAAPRPLPAASPTQALRHRRTGRRRISSHRFTRGVAAAGRGPKVQVLEILAALKGPQVQAEVLCTVILLQASGGGEGEEGIDRRQQRTLPAPSCQAWAQCPSHRRQSGMGESLPALCLTWVFKALFPKREAGGLGCRTGLESLSSPTFPALLPPEWSLEHLSCQSLQRPSLSHR